MASLLDELFSEIDQKAMENYEENLLNQKISFFQTNKDTLIETRKVEIFNQKLDEMVKDINAIQEAVGKKPVMERYHYGFNAQKIIGILSTIAYSGENKILFCVKYNISSALLNDFQSSVGQFPYADKNLIYHAGTKGNMPMLVFTIKKFLNSNNILIPEHYFDSLTQEWFNEKYAQEEAKASVGISDTVEA